MRRPNSDKAISVSITNLRKEFRRRGGERVVAVDDVSLEIQAGLLVILLGPSGCGKTTLLRCIAGLEYPDSGRIEISGQCVYDSARGIALPPERRDISMMFQSYALWPHMTAYQNVEYAVRSRGKSREVARERSLQALDQVRIAELRDQYPGQMSGGQQQRVALARSLAVDPQVVLFDEPLSNVDAKVRYQLRRELVLMQRQLNFAGVYVTHDQVEALQMADLVAVMRDGRIQQLGTPKEVYRFPTTRYVATFVGQANELEGQVSEVRRSDGQETQLVVQTTLGSLRAVGPYGDHRPGDRVSVIIRPEDLAIFQGRPAAAANAWAATVEVAMFSGGYSEYRITAKGTPLQVWSAQRDMFEEGQQVFLFAEPTHIHVLARDKV
jgi:iron(III) transport system ATP-binding protein